jgi:hypothetical protein
MNGKQFRQAQAQVLMGRTECWSCNCLFSQAELRNVWVSVKIGKVVTAEYKVQALLLRDDIDVETIDLLDERKDLYQEVPVLMCGNCQTDYSEDWKTWHFDIDGTTALKERESSDLYLD